MKRLTLIAAMIWLMVNVGPALACSEVEPTPTCPDQNQTQSQTINQNQTINQDQSQDQVQDQNQDQAQSQKSKIVYIEARDPVRLTPHEINFPGLIPISGPEHLGNRFRRVEDMILYGNEFTIESLFQNVADKTLRDNEIKRTTDPLVLNQTIKIVLTKQENVRRIGFVGAVAINGCTSVDALITVCLLAFKRGASIVHVTDQGVNPVVRGSAKGFGGGVSQGIVSESGMTASGFSGLFGKSSGETRTDHDPYINGISLDTVGW